MSKENPDTPEEHLAAAYEKLAELKAKREAPAYRKAVLEYLSEHQTCEIGPIILAAGFEVLCLDTSTHVHHLRGRGKYLCDKTTFKASCSGQCHPWFVHTGHKDVAIKLGLLLPPLCRPL